MQITDVETMLIHFPTPRTIADSHNVFNKIEFVVALVHTDEGITGTGYTVTRSF